MAKKLLLKISGMHCSSCAMNIDGELEDTKGVKEVNTSYAKGQTEVTYDEKLVDQDEIIEAIKTAGYTANPL
ncbi:MAG: copper chaperone [Patescibacteria group bacterium]|jgi:Cu+-exporting ATPase|nr:copper chaperone [Patescibacteria group bacterium]